MGRMLIDQPQAVTLFHQYVCAERLADKPVRYFILPDAGNVLMRNDCL